MSTVFRPYSASDSVRSDRSAGDRQRHRQKVREAIRKNLADIIAEEAIIGKSADHVIKVPIQGVKEYRFVFGKNAPRVAAGDDGDLSPGDAVGRAIAQGGGIGGGGQGPGVDYYETDITVEELIDIMFDDLELPDLERKRLMENLVIHGTRRRGSRRVGVRAQLDKKRTAVARIRRRIASDSGAMQEAGVRFPFHREDLRYHRRMPDIESESNAVVICIMDTSGSMGTMKKYLARSFFFLLYQFVRTRYRKVDLVFIAHATEAHEVTEEAFFHKGESGGTMISSGYRKALEIIQARYHPSLWNVYAFHCSDGENFEPDNEEALSAAKELCELCNLFGYGEIRPLKSDWGGRSSMSLFERVDADNFGVTTIERKEDLWPAFRSLLSKDRGTKAPSG